MAAIAVGAHYFGFRTAYGDATYWLLGSVMCLVSLTAIFMKMPAETVVPYAVAAIEVAFGVWLTWIEMSQARSRGAQSSADQILGG